MWCTRWYIPLLLLPLPTAPPYFLLIFLFSLTLHARPCFYCIILLTALFVSSCYWQPLPISENLSVPWSENISTFADALKASLSKPDTPLPSTMPVADRCWCDLSSGSVFEPFSISNWERISVERVKEELDQQHDEQTEVSEPETTIADGDVDPSPSIPSPAVTPSDAPFSDRLPAMPTWFSISSLFTRESKHDPPDQFPPAPAPITLSDEQPSAATNDPTDAPTPPPTPPHRLPHLRPVYDLRPYGFDIIMDFGWSREPSIS